MTSRSTLTPEQIEGETSDVRSDIYSCGMVLYEVFTGHYAYTERSQMRDVLLDIKDSAPTPPSEHWDKIPPALETILLRGLCKDPAERFASIEVWDALQQVSSRRVA